MFNKNDELTLEMSERIKKLQVIINSFEDMAIEYGPASSEELKNRINKVIRNFENYNVEILGFRESIFSLKKYLSNIFS